MPETFSPLVNVGDLVAVTGATGYVGGRLVPALLEAGYRVRCLVREPRKLDSRPWRHDPRVEVIAGDLAQISPLVEETFTVPGSDPTWLLYDFLGELHAAFEVRRMLFREFRVTITADGLAAVAKGERYDPTRHVLAHEVKAITQHELAVERSPDHCTATYIVDI